MDRRGHSRRSGAVVPAVVLVLLAAACSRSAGSNPNGSGPPGGTAGLPTVETVAGTGAAGFSGEGGPAASALLNQPVDVVVDRTGNLLIADLGNQRVRMVDGTGIITTVAGIATSGFTGDGGPATAAELNHPASVVVDGTGRIYVADRDNQRIRVVGGSGVIQTLAGTGIPGFSGDGGPATAAQLNQPAGLAIDRSGDVFVADSGNARVRAIGPDGTITTVGGIGSRGYTGDGGPATAAQLNFPVDVAVTSRGELFIADLIGDVVRVVRPDGTIGTVAGTGFGGFSGDGGPAQEAQLNHPSGIAIDADGNLFIADSGNGRIREVTPDGTIRTVAGPGVALFAPGVLPPTLARLGGLAIDANDDLLLADAGGNRVGRLPLSP